MRRQISIAFIILALCIPSFVWALGIDWLTRPADKSSWPAGLAEIVNVDDRVHGWSVNFQDMFFFRGDAAAFNAFLAKCHALPDTKLEVVVHPGKMEVKSPWDKKPRDISANWQLYASPFDRKQMTAHDIKPDIKPGPFTTRIDVWLGDSLKLGDVHVPDNVPIGPIVEIAPAPTTGR